MTQVVKLAFTGVAAYNIGGMTIHAFFGLDTQEMIPNHIQLDRFLKLHKRVSFLIDECSMISSQVFDVLDSAMQVATKKWIPWGGLPLVLFGDFAQLLPFGGDEHQPVMKARMLRDIPVEHVYHPCRQTDQQFFSVLNSIRCNTLDNPQVARALGSRVIQYEDIPPSSVVLFAYKLGANEYNTRQLQRMPGQAQEYHAIDNIGQGGYTAQVALARTSLPQVM